MRLEVLSIALLGVVVTACSPTADYDGAGTSARLSSVTLVKITEDHVGGITKETSYGQKAIEAALPGFTTEGIQTA
ncbi:MAG: DUF1131 domain-containing protein, partial [Roseibium sp.]|nr:DUF1131 domain-containing protein [Roseibium sp.]